MVISCEYISVSSSVLSEFSPGSVAVIVIAPVVSPGINLPALASSPIAAVVSPGVTLNSTPVISSVFSATSAP